MSKSFSAPDRTVPVVAVVLALLFGLAGCGSDADPDVGGQTSTTCEGTGLAEGSSNTTLIGDGSDAAPVGGNPAAEGPDGESDSNSAAGDLPEPSLPETDVTSGESC